MKKLKQFFKSRFGEGYVDVAVTILIVAFVLVFAVNVVSLVALNQNIKTAADQLTDYAAMKGTVSVDEYARELKEKIGIKKSIHEYGIDEKYFMDTLDDMVEQAFNDQCTAANPRYPLMKEIKELYLKCW